MLFQLNNKNKKMLSKCAIMSYVLFVVISMLFLFHGIRDYKKFGTLEKLLFHAAIAILLGIHTCIKGVAAILIPESK